MKKLFPIIIFFLFFTKASAQSHIKFIDGIDLKADAVEYGIADPLERLKPKVEMLTVVPVTKSIKLATEACKSIQFKYAQLMDMDIEDITNFTMFHFVENWLKTKYRYGGTTKAGIDCSAFTGQLFCSIYSNTIPRTASEQYNLCAKIDKENLQEGDLVFFKNKRSISHVGMYLGNDCFVHSSTNSGVTISKLTDDYYSRKFIGGGRIVK